MRLWRVSLPPATSGQMLPANVTAQVLPQSSSSASWGPAGPCAALPPAHVLMATISKKTPGCISHLGKCDLLIVFSVVFFPRSAAASDFYPLPLILLVQPGLGFRHLISSNIKFAFLFLLLLGARDNFPEQVGERLTLPCSHLKFYFFFLQKENHFIISLNIK